MPSASDAPLWRFLIDENLPERLTGYLRSDGYEAEHAYEVGLRTRPDQDVFAYAQTAGATLITQAMTWNAIQVNSHLRMQALFLSNYHRRGHARTSYSVSGQRCVVWPVNRCKIRS